MHTQNDNSQLLDEIYQGLQMGIQAINILMDKTKDANFKQQLELIRNDNYQMATETKQMLQNVGESPDEIGVFSKAQSWTGIQMGTLVNQSNTHMADMMIDGSMMGMKEITKALHSYPNAEANTKALAERFISTQEKHLQMMKNFL